MTIELFKTFIIKSYGLQELALMYFPDSSPQAASSQLRRWMRIKQLSDKLRESGFVKGQKLLTPKQVAVIVGHVGEP